MNIAGIKKILDKLSTFKVSQNIVCHGHGDYAHEYEVKSEQTYYGALTELDANFLADAPNIIKALIQLLEKGDE